MNKNEHNHVHGVKTCAEKEHHSHHNHNHHFHHHHSHQHSADENILVAFFLNLFFVFVELAGGFLTNSFAILSDAVHDFGDCVAIGFAYLMEKYSNKTPDEKYTYGYRRYSLLSAIITSLILVIGSIFILIGSVTRFNEQGEISGLGMLIIAVFGVVVNGIAVVKTRKGTGVNERAISLTF
jgi:cobalt-zinc-cadmium efflux system protein